MDKRIYTSKLGFTLVEVIIAIGLLSMAVVGPLYFTTNSINTGLASKNQLTAFYLAQEAIEYVKAKRDANFYGGGNWLQEIGTGNCLSDQSGCIIDVFVDSPNDIKRFNDEYVQYNSNTGRYGHSLGGNSVFKRFFKTEKIGNDEAKVTVTVTWNERIIGAKEVKLEEHIFNWNLP